MSDLEPTNGISDENVLTLEELPEHIAVTEAERQLVVRAKIAYDEQLVSFARLTLRREQVQREVDDLLKKEDETLAKAREELKEREAALQQWVKMLAATYNVADDNVFNIDSGSFFKP